MHWQQVSSHMLATNLPDHYLNTGAKMRVQQKLMAGEECDYPFCSQKQFKVAIAQSSTLSSFLQRYFSHLCLHLSFTALNPPTPAVTTFVSFLVESIGLASWISGSSSELIQALALTVTASHLKILHLSPQVLQPCGLSSKHTKDKVSTSFAWSETLRYVKLSLDLWIKKRCWCSYIHKGNYRKRWLGVAQFFSVRPMLRADAHHLNLLSY